MDEVTKAINHFSVLMEDQNAKLDAVLEGMNSLPTRADFYRLEDKVDDLSQRMEVVEAAVKDVSGDLKQHTGLPMHVAHGHE
jgi:RecJ-like exonuclease